MFTILRFVDSTPRVQNNPVCRLSRDVDTFCPEHCHMLTCSASGGWPVTPTNGRPAFALSDQSELSIDNNTSISAVKPDGNISNCILTTYDDTLMSRVNIKPIAKYFSDGDKKWKWSGLLTSLPGPRVILQKNAATHETLKYLVSVAQSVLTRSKWAPD